MIRFSKRKRVDSSLNVAPLIDIVLLLLIFFLLTSVFMEPGLELTLPEARTAAAVTAEGTVVHITKDGEVYLNDEPVSWQELKGRLQARLVGRSDKALIVKADRDAPFGVFVRVLDISREVGASNLTISTTLPRKTDADTEAQSQRK